MASPKPAVIVRREFEATPDVVAQQLRACIVGPSCELVRYGVAAEKSKGFISTVATRTGTNGTDRSIFSADATYSIPTVVYSSLLDADYVKLFVEDAYISYAHLAQASNFSSSNLAAGTNVLAAINSSTGWKGSSRNANLVQDVVVGDIVEIYDSTGLRHSSVVSGFDGTVSSAAVGTIAGTQADTLALEASSGISSSATGASQTAINGITGFNFTLVRTSYLTGTTAATYAADPRSIGKTVTNYTLTTTASTSTTVDYTVVSDTGLDNITGTGKTTGVTTTLPSGATVALAFSSQPPIGAKITFSITVGHTKLTVGAGGTFAVTAGTLSTSTPNTTYIISCIKGGSFANENITNAPEFQVSTNNGADVTSIFKLTLNSAAQTVNIGSYGLQLTTAVGGTGATPANQQKGFVRGDVFTIAVTGATVPVLDKLVFADAVTGTTFAPTQLRLSKKKTVELGRYQPNGVTPNWSLQNASDSDSRSLLVENILITRDSAVNNSQTDAYVTAGKFYMQYRAFQAIARQVGSVNTLADITTQLGTIDVDNPLAYGVYKAWSNANGATVHFIPTVSQTLNGNRGFADALALAKGNRNCYGLVPLTTSSEIWNAFVGHVQDESAPATGRFRVMWIAPEVEIHNKIQDKDSTGVNIYGTSASFTAGKWYVNAVSEAGGQVLPKFTETVQVGDYVRTKFNTNVFGGTTFVEYKVLAVVDNDTLVISSATDPALSNFKIEIFRDLTSAATAAKYAQVAGGFSSDRVFAVVPDRGVNGLRVDGTPVKNWYIACAFAGLRSGSRPQQPLSNVELLGFDGVNITSPLFSESDLNILRDGGVWAVRNTDEGKIYVERQLSTSTLDLYRKEQSVTCNVDSVSFTLADALRNLVGRVNITEETKGLVEATIRQTLGTLAATNGAITVGPQLKTYTIVSVTVPATAQDTLLVKVQISVPLPMNIIDITLVI
jgi:hypothetical protein